MKGKIGYQIFVDRFNNFNNKNNNFLDWDTPIKAHEKQEYDFYGGNLLGITKKINYLKKLNIDFLYLTPIFKANTNHRYDTVDFEKIDEIIGSEEDLNNLFLELKINNIDLFLDIALNHTSKYSVLKNNVDFYTGKNWADVNNLPELNIDNEELKNYFFKFENSILKKFLKKGISNWRLDCAYDLGYSFLNELKSELNKTCDNKLIGEVWSYPKKWLSILDGIMNYYYFDLIKNVLSGNISGKLFTKIVIETFEECGYSLFNCWNMLSSHDTPRILTEFKNKYKLAVILQFALPGSPLIYYGEEIGLNGDNDPYCRETMKWEKVNEDNEFLNFYKVLIDEYKNSSALNSGDISECYYSDKEIIAFERKSEKIRENRIIIINPTNEEKEIIIYTKNSSLMNNSKIIDCLTGLEFSVFNSSIKALIPPLFGGIFKIKEEKEKYNFYKRID